MRVLLGTLLAISLSLPNLAAQEKKRVAVMDFDYATVSSSVAAIFGTNVDVGKGIGDLLINQLVEGGKYTVIERSALDAVLAEQNFSNSNRANPSSAAQIGKVLGVDAIIIGSITQFGRDDQNKSIGGLGAVTGSFGIGRVGKNKSKAVVGLNSRIIDINTAEILAVAKGFGESKRSSTSLGGRGGNWGTAVGGGNIDMGSSNFANTILGEAVSAAVDEMSLELQKSADVLPTREVEINGLVADAAGGVLILNVGTNGGVKVGTVLDVRRVIREVKDPTSGRVLRSITEKLGTVTITEADEISSVGQFAGDAEVKVGDMVKNP
jgi:curli biogenesis system outer membrane secretion channel CsgG